MSLRQYDVVRVRKLLHPPEVHDGWRVNQRPPRVGDVGTVVEILKAPGYSDCYVVESCDSDGFTIFLGYFQEDELEAFDVDQPTRVP